MGEPRAFLGTDIGATKSHALVADETGQVLGFGRGGSGNYEDVGWSGFRVTLAEITASALAAAGLQPGEIAGAGFGVAGYDWPSEASPMLEAIGALDLGCPVALVNDALIGLVAGASVGWGVAVVAGTSVNCWGRDRTGRLGRMIGYGSRVAEYAGALELVERAVQEVARAWTRRGPPTRLTEALLALTGAEDEGALFEGLTLGRLQIPPSAALRVFEVAAQGDPVAQEVVRWAGKELGGLAVGVIRQLDLAALAVEVVLAGSLFGAGRPLIGPLEEVVRAEAPGAQLVRLNAPPVVGGVLLGMERAGVDVARVRPRLLDSTARFVEGEVDPR